MSQRWICLGVTKFWVQRGQEVMFLCMCSTTKERELVPESPSLSSPFPPTLSPSTFSSSVPDLSVWEFEDKLVSLKVLGTCDWEIFTGETLSLTLSDS